MKRYLPIILVVLLLVQQVNAQGNTPVLEIVQMKYDPFPAEAGKYVKLFVKVENSGSSEARNVVCTLQPEYPFSLDSNENPLREIGTLHISGDFLLEYKIRVASDAVEGDNELKVACGTNGLENSFVKKLSLNVESKNPEFAIGLVSSDPEEIKTDMDDIKLTVEVQNVGEGDAKLTTVELGLPEGFSASTSFSTLANLGAIEKDSLKEAVFTIDTGDIEVGLHEAMIIIEYKDDNNNKNEYTKQILHIELKVMPSPSLSINEVKAGVQTASDSFTGYLIQEGVVVTQSTLTQGQAGELRIRVINTGQEEAESVSVKVFEDSNIPINFDEIFDYIGTLEPGLSGEAVFTFTIDGDAILKEYMLETEIRYIDGDTVHTTSNTIPIGISTPARDNILLFVGVAIVVVIAGLVLWKKKR